MSSAVISNTDIVGYNTPATCVEVGALFATALARKNDYSAVGFDTSVRRLEIDPSDSIITNTKRIATPGGGTDVSAPLRHWNAKKEKADLVFIISDNESWFDSSYRTYATSAQTQWQAFRKRNPGAAIVCINLTASKTTQILQDKGVLNIGGFNDSIFSVVSSFLMLRNNKDFWVKTINAIPLE
jgi:60 kDa SS-A/Ro ribonucleoprotein